MARIWGLWRLNDKNYTLELVFREEDLGEAEPTLRYYVDLERCLTSAEVLDWIFQIRQKTWAKPDVMTDLLKALSDVLHPQAHLCSFGNSMELENGQLRDLVRRAAAKA